MRVDIQRNDVKMVKSRGGLGGGGGGEEEKEEEEEEEEDVRSSKIGR